MKRLVVALVVVVVLVNAVVVVSGETTFVIPVIDLTPWWNNNKENTAPCVVVTKNATTTPCLTAAQRSVVDQVARACRDIGFFAVTVGGNDDDDDDQPQVVVVDQAIVQRAWSAAADFFALPLETKQTLASANATEYPYGYERQEVLQRGRQQQHDNSEYGRYARADLKETFSIGPSNPAAGMPRRRHYTAQLPDLASALDDYYAQMQALAQHLLQIFAVTLQLPADWFDDKMDRHLSALRLLHYYEIETKTTNNDNHHQYNNNTLLRAGPHTDYGVLTILKTGGPGLQVQTPSAHKEEEEWVDVPYLENAFVINIGDLMERWTAHRWVSTLHRVVAVVPPSAGNNGTTTTSYTRIPARQSLAYFVNLNGDAVVTPLESCLPTDDQSARAQILEQYPPIAAKDHLMSKYLLASRGVPLEEETAKEKKNDEL